MNLYHGRLAKITGLTPTAITGIIRELLNMGLVKEVGLDNSRGGRRPVKLKFNPEAAYVIGIDDRIVQGFQGHAGEIGHIVIMEEGPLCNCGNRGCLESFAAFRLW
jgi:predicted NBD/HSP70 family sugar kinase